MKKIYNITGIGLAAFLGGPLAAGYLFYKNYQTIGKIELAKRAIQVSIIVAIIIFGSLTFLPFEMVDKIPNYLLPVIFLVISKLLADRYQKAEIEAYVSNGGENYSNWRTAGISLIFAAITLVVAMVIFLLVDLLIP